MIIQRVGGTGVPACVEARYKITGRDACATKANWVAASPCWANLCESAMRLYWP